MTAIFLIVVLAAIGAYMVTISGVQQTTPVSAVQGSRAFHAAKSGVEWAVFRILAAGPGNYATTCQNTVNANNFTLNQPGLNDFSVSLDCVSTPHSEGGDNLDVISITATATFRSLGDPDFVRRVINATVTPPP